MGKCDVEGIDCIECIGIIDDIDVIDDIESIRIVVAHLLQQRGKQFE